mmetsp:Transcript_25445/g.83715  ORF Transcript_25445/g.83715 Transcript_25445/m.83715 type:complete len:596 (+) Transcript_25445:179-1966(+)
MVTALSATAISFRRGRPAVDVVDCVKHRGSTLRRFVFNDRSRGAVVARGPSAVFAVNRRGCAAHAAVGHLDGGDSTRRAGLLVRRLCEKAAATTHRLDGLWGQLSLMSGLFFGLVFVNTILDATKDTLVVTAAGGGAETIPFLVLWCVWPASFAFVALYTRLSRRYTRATLFNGILVVFACFFLAFAAMFPVTSTLHPDLTGVAAALPAGMRGMLAVASNWTFSLFYVVAELFSDVALGLLFWALANETTRLADASTLYPLFGVLANFAQAGAGQLLKLLGRAADAGAAQWSSQLQLLLALTAVLCGAMVLLHAVIVKSAEERGMYDDDARQPQHEEANRASEKGSGGDDERTKEAQADEMASSGSEPKHGLAEAFAVIRSNPAVTCLAVCAAAQGVTMNLLDVLWKSHLRLLAPTPAEYSSYLGDVATLTGVTSAALMLCSPSIFALCGWGRAASAMPRVLQCVGGAFVSLALARAWWFEGSPAMLSALVGVGALMVVLARASKFALFKPAEEMVYITLGADCRSKGKAAIDVVVSQAGKTTGSAVQQCLLILCAGVATSTVPAVGCIAFLILTRWIAAIDRLSELRTELPRNE